MRQGVVGILGGMGPDATARLFQLMIVATPAECDQDHLRTLIDSNPKIPDRTAAILGTGIDPLPRLLESGRTLAGAGADFLVMPCNTAHHWLPELRESLPIPFLDMIEETAAAVANRRPRLRRVGLLATAGTLKSGLYAAALSRRGVDSVQPGNSEQERVMRVIYGIKAGNQAVRRDLLAVGRGLLASGAESLILGCTELSLVDEMRELGCPLFDPLALVARRAVEVASDLDGSQGLQSLLPAA